ncbi:MAG: hypothetical protein R2824_24175 [Saprospiraceae bacterium]|nr:hypothetical protein [Lewinella sp.]
MIKNILQVGAGTIFFIWGNWFAESDLRPELLGMAIGIIAALSIELIYFLYTERYFLQLYLNCLILKRNSELRLSIAYIFKIEVRGKYLLVKNSRFNIPTYQPVGGVYKYFHPEATKVLSNMSVVADNAIDNDEKSEFDLRQKMSKRKNIRKFLKWFFGSIERESDPWREFYEELVATKILPSEKFKYIYYDLTGQHFEPIHFDNYFNIDTLKYVDVYTPRFVNQQQKDELDKIFLIKSDEYIWVTEDEISKKFSRDGKRISDHAHKIFFTKKLN